MKKGKKLCLIIGSAVIILAATALLIIFSTIVTVPDVKGLTKEQATQVLNDAGLTLNTEIQFSNRVDEGYVISQDIAANKRVKKHSTITAKISAGASNTVGTTVGNANSFGMVTTQGNWIYFIGSDYAIYRTRNDESKTERICDSAALSLNVIGKWIYFADGSSDGGIYKIKIDGTEKTKLSDTTSYNVYVDGKWIYYTSEYWGGSLYKMKTDGSSVTQIFSENCNEYIVHDKYIYYINSKYSKVYRCNLDGTGKTLLSPDFSGNYLALVGDKLAISNGYNIQTINLDGSGLTSFGNNNVQCSFLNGYDGWIYYLEQDFRGEVWQKSFVKIRPDGSMKTKIYDYDYLNHPNPFLDVVDGWIYFRNEHDQDTTYRISIDGKNFEKFG